MRLALALSALISLAACTPLHVEIVSPESDDDITTRSSPEIHALVSSTQGATHELLGVWSSDVDGELGEGFVVEGNGEARVWTGGLSEGYHSLSFVVIDEAGNEGGDEVTIYVAEAEDGGCGG